MKKQKKVILDSSGIKYYKNRENVIVDTVIWILLILIFIMTAYPFYYCIIASFSDGYDFMRGGVFFYPRKPTLGNYQELLSDPKWLMAFPVSFFRTIVGTLLTVFMTSLLSYALSRKDLMFGSIYKFFVVFSMYVSGGLIPFYILLKNLHLLNTIWVYIFPSMLNLFFVIVGINFFSSIPASLVESAKLDGATEFQVLLRVVLPLSRAFLATLALFTAVNQWNSWLDSTYYVSDEKLRTVAYRMVTAINQSAGAATISGGTIVSKSTALTSQATAMVVSMLPIMLVYPFLQKYFVQGLMIGAVKE